MHWKKKTLKDGTVVYEFMYWDNKQKTNKRVPKALISHIKTDEEANDYKKHKEAEHQAVAFRIKMRMRWREKYYNFENLLDIYKEDRKENSPNSWKTSVYYLEHYIFPFFLGERELNNINNWSLFFEDFKDYLKRVKTAKGNREIAVNTRNNCIISLNSFLEMMARKGKAEWQRKCPPFPKYLGNSRSLEDIYSYTEIEQLSFELKSSSPVEYEFFMLLAHTGMRINEARGLSLRDVSKGDTPDKILNTDLKKIGREVKAYIFLRSQPDKERREAIRNEDGTISRRDLKGDHRIKEEKKGRFIPISNPGLYEIIKRRRSEALDALKVKKWGDNKSDYILFEDLIIIRFERRLKRACENIGIKYRSPHAIRHSFATILAGETESHKIVSKILGHKKEETTQGYIHLSAQMKREHEIQRSINDEDEW